MSAQASRIVKVLLFAFVLLWTYLAQANLSCFSFIEKSGFSFEIKQSEDAPERFYAFWEGVEVAFIDHKFLIDQQVLVISDLQVKENFRRKGLSKKLIEKLMGLYPKTRAVKSWLVSTNFETFIEAFDQQPQSSDKNKERQNVETALLSTPAFKVRKHLGFGRLLDYSLTPDYIDFVVVKEE